MTDFSPQHLPYYYYYFFFIQFTILLIDLQINFVFAVKQNLGLLSVAPFHCHGIHKLYSSSSSKKLESSKIGDGIDLKQQKIPQIPVTPGESGSTNASQNGENKLSVFQRFKKTYKEHGKVLIFVEVATSIFWYGLFYTIVSW